MLRNLAEKNVFDIICVKHPAYGVGSHDEKKEISTWKLEIMKNWVELF